MPDEHAKRAPSHSDTWALCAGSLYEEAKYATNDEGSEESRLGTAAHTLLWEWFNTAGFGLEETAKVQPSHYMGYELRVGDHTYLADENMIQAVASAYGYVQGILAENPGAQMYAEQKVYPGKAWKRNDCWGTADIIILAPKKIYVLDYKHGEGVMVEAEGHFQTMLYLIGVIIELGQDYLNNVEEFITGILQPRGYHQAGPFRTCKYSLGAVQAWMEWFGQRIAATDDPNAPLTPGDKQCHWCRGKPGCPALTNKMFEMVQASDMKGVESQVLKEPKDLDLNTINIVDDLGELIIRYVKAVKEYKRDLMMQGVDFPGFKLVEGKKGNRKFNKEDKAVLNFLSRNFGIKKAEVTTTKLIGPADVLALANKSPDKTDDKIKRLEKLIDRPAGKPTVAPESDPRPAINSNVEAMFKDAPQPNQEVQQ